MGGAASREAADRYKRMPADGSPTPVEMKSPSRFGGGGARRRKGGGGGGHGHGHGHANPVLDAANEKKYQSLNYDEVHSGTFYKEVVHSKHEKIAEIKREHNWTMLWVWIFCGIIGFITAMAAFFIDFSVEHIADFKFGLVRPMISACNRSETHKNGSHMLAEEAGCLVGPWAVLTSINVGFVFIASAACAYGSQAASGSGIPEIKCFLNGIRCDPWLSARTMMVKVFGVLFSVGASMPVGKEGPMIHSGAIAAAVAPRFMQRKINGKWEYIFRNDRVMRDFVSGGAAAGVAAAFGAPIGGVLFSLEEGCSFWNQALTWRIMFTTMCTLLVLNIFVSGILKAGNSNSTTWGQLEKDALIDFGSFNLDRINPWSVIDLLAFVGMGIVGGLFGGFWNGTQTAITKYRMRRKGFTKVWMVVEACFFSLVNTTIMYAMAMAAGTCQKMPTNETEAEASHSFKVQGFFCDPETEYNDMATLAFNPMERTIFDLFHFEGTFSPVTCGVYFLAVGVTACWTYGLMIPSGLFVPSIAAGAAYGRLIGELMVLAGRPVHRGTYALVGSAAFLGGVVRMTISLTVILVEATNQVGLSFPIMVALMTAKWVGDCFNKGIYDIHIHLKKIPLLEHEVEVAMHRFVCEDVMITDLLCFEKVHKLSDIVQTLQDYEYNGFPVVDGAVVNSPRVPTRHGRSYSAGGRYMGTILRHQLIIILKHRGWGELVGNTAAQDATNQEQIPAEAFVTNFPHRENLADIKKYLPTQTEMDNLWIDLRPYMNFNTYTLTPQTTLSRAYTMFRGLGLRHVMIMNENSNVIGMITRKEISEFRVEELEEELDARQHDGMPVLNGAFPRSASSVSSVGAPIAALSARAHQSNQIYEDD